MLVYDFPYTNVDLDRVLHYYYNGKFYNSQYAAAKAAIDGGAHSVDFAYSKIQATLFRYLSPFSDINCKKEPTESFEDLCRDRAQYLRDTFRNITLSFGGGSDSLHILNIFLKYKIKLDNIILVKDDFKIIDKSDNKANEIEDLVGVPLLKQAHEQLGADVSIYKSSDLFSDINHYYTELSKRDLFSRGERLLPNPRNQLIGTIGMRSESITIRGSSEPFIFYDKKLKKWYFEINDTDNFLGGHQYSNSIPFYTDPRYPKLFLKQVHLMKNFMQENNVDINCRSNYGEYKKIMMRVARDIPQNILNVYESSYFFDKGVSPLVSHTNPLLRSVLRSRNQVYLAYLYNNHKKSFNTLIDSLKLKIDNIPIFNFSKTFLIAKQYLE